MEDRDILDDFDTDLTKLVAGTANELLNSGQAERIITIIGMLEITKANLLRGIETMVDNAEEDEL